MSLGKWLMARQRPLHIAHRGGAALVPENTLFAFAQAVERYQTDMIETDVQLTADGEVVVFHDDTVERCTDGNGRVDGLTWAELQRLDAAAKFSPDGKTRPLRGQGIGIPRLVDLLRAHPDLPLNIDVKPKNPALVLAFAAVIRAENALNRVCVGSEHDTQAEALYDALPEALHFYPKAALIAFVTAAMMGQALPDDPRWTVLDMPLSYQGMRLISPAFVRSCRAAGKWVNVWTIDDEAEMRRLVNEGVGGIMTDRPDRLRAVLTPI